MLLINRLLWQMQEGQGLDGVLGCRLTGDEMKRVSRLSLVVPEREEKASVRLCCPRRGGQGRSLSDQDRI